MLSSIFFVLVGVVVANVVGIYFPDVSKKVKDGVEKLISKVSSKLG